MKTLDVIDRVVGILAMLVGIAAGAAICIVVSNGAGANGQNWAAWVQAIGSILALGVAIFLAEVERSHRRSEREQERHEREYGSAFDLVSIATELHMTIVELEVSLDQHRGRGYYTVVLGQLKDLGARLSECTAGDIPPARKVLVLEFRKFMRGVMEHVAGEAMEQERGERPDWVTWRETAKRLFDQVKMLIPNVSREHK